MPTAEEVYQNGLAFLASPSEEIKRQAPYCFLASALQGHAAAQFQLAKMYNKGDILAQDDLSAYKWAMISAANGNQDAQGFALSLEQVLSTRDLEIVTAEIKNNWDRIQDEQRKELEELSKKAAALKQESGQAKETAEIPVAPVPTNLSDIFTAEDRF